jgi:hypothetical protein
MSFVKNNKRYLYICLALPIALGLSYIEIDPHTFGFPFNLVLCLLCVYVSVLAGRLSEHFLFFSGRKAVGIAFITIVILMVLHWLFYHRRLFFCSFFPSVSYDFSKSALFVSLWMLFIIILGAVIVRRLTLVKQNNKWFLWNHMGLYLVLLTGFMGSTDTYTMQTILAKEQETNFAFTELGEAMKLPFHLILKDIQIQRDHTGLTIQYKAMVSLKDVQKEKTRSIAVNHPCRFKGYDIYVMQASDFGCKLQIIYDPWRYAILFSILIMISGAVVMFFKGTKIQKQDDRLG